VTLKEEAVAFALQATSLPRGLFGSIQAVRLRRARLKEIEPSPATDLSRPKKVYTIAQVDGARPTARNSLTSRKAGVAENTLISIDPSAHYQTIEGFSGAFTEDSTYVFPRLSDEKQRELLNAYFDVKSGHGYRFCRTHSDSCEISLGSYVYDDMNGDYDLKHLSIGHNRKPLIPFIKAAHAAAGSITLKFLASP
jgi:O-glycosyl hydrolase